MKNKGGISGFPAGPGSSHCRTRLVLTHRVHPPQQQLRHADVDLGAAQLVRRQQVGQVHPLCRLAATHLGFQLRRPPVDEALRCRSTNRNTITFRELDKTSVALLPRTDVVEVVPGLNKAPPEGEEAARPAREEDHQVRQAQHVADGGDEVQSLLGNVLLQAAQPGLKQDGGDTWR